MSGYIVGYRCPKCGDKVIRSTFFPDNLVLCSDMGHWAGTLEECEKVDEIRFAFESFMDENQLRFHTGQFTEEDIAYSAFLAGIDYIKEKWWTL